MTHKNTTHGMSHTRPWVIWTDMKRRCKNTGRNGYEFYGARGISYDPKWETFSGFWEDMAQGYGDEMTLDRKDPSKDYCKENCQWLEGKYQNKNKNKYKTNNTGVAGTYISKNKGVDTLYAHISHFGKRFCKGFSLRKYTLEDALNLAISWREEKLEEYGYSEFHGEAK